MHLEDLGLHGDVERRRRLVGDQHLGVVGDRHRDHHALAHAAGELVRVLLGALVRLRDADDVEQVDRLAVRRRLRRVLVGAGSSRRSGRRSSAPGSAPTAGPGRSSRPACRAPIASACSAAPTSSTPATVAEPEIFADGGSRPSRPRNVTDLPEPRLADDARPSRRAPTSRSTPRTACTSPLSVLNETRKSRSERTGSARHGQPAPPGELGVGGVTQTVADEVDADRDAARAARTGTRRATSSRS